MSLFHVKFVSAATLTMRDPFSITFVVLSVQFDCGAALSLMPVLFSPQYRYCFTLDHHCLLWFDPCCVTKHRLYDTPLFLLVGEESVLPYKTVSIPAFYLL